MEGADALTGATLARGKGGGTLARAGGASASSMRSTEWSDSRIARGAGGMLGGAEGMTVGRSDTAGGTTVFAACVALTGATLAGGTLAGATLAGATLAGATLGGATLFGVGRGTERGLGRGTLAFGFGAALADAAGFAADLVAPGTLFSGARGAASRAAAVGRVVEEGTAVVRLAAGWGAPGFAMAACLCKACSAVPTSARPSQDAWISKGSERGPGNRRRNVAERRHPHGWIDDAWIAKTPAGAPIRPRGGPRAAR